ncbi:hypothetical protein SISSUDRAFT_1051599 [Sistotremastrum suecicum HHB10207 ss-3]|uniref:Uncharacterized protein n=1 Tax=Sistotremastrum suecicum HHB10207 ss-3 TaxID=1314776 RepID=A0A166AH46_9AGAM|nr:hypothetical protein SISSUDRAFT_1051599 [Sistotremastrum suecicum HHB10207 ss-3]
MASPSKSQAKEQCLPGNRRHVRSPVGPRHVTMPHHPSSVFRSSIRNEIARCTPSTPHRPWMDMSSEEKMKAVEDAMERVQRKAQDDTSSPTSCRLTLVATLPSTKTTASTADYVCIDTSTTLRVEAFLPSPTHGLQRHCNPHLQDIEDAFCKLAQTWFAECGILVGDEEDEEADQEDCEAED